MTAERMAGLRLNRIRVYPLKGAAGIDVPEVHLDEFGIPGDRRWMLTTPDGRFLSQRTHPRLCLLQVSLSRAEEEGGHRFTVSAPGQGSLPLREERMDRWDNLRVHDDRFAALVGDGEADRWFTGFLGEPCRLAYFPVGGERWVDPEFAPGNRVAFADGYPLHLVSQESLQDLNRQVAPGLSMFRFRPNLVIGGSRPWEEDEWRALRVGEVTIRLVKPCARCSVTTVDQGTGMRGVEPLRTLMRVREWDGKVYFGQNGVFEEPGRFRVGENVHILEKGPRRPPLQC